MAAERYTFRVVLLNGRSWPTRRQDPMRLRDVKAQVQRLHNLHGIKAAYITRAGTSQEELYEDWKR